MRDDIIRMWEKANGWSVEGWPSTVDEIERFAKLVAAAEREACASIEVHLTTPDRDYTNMSPLDAYEIALIDAAMAFREAIRARGQG